MICPKCGFSQPDDIYCANCGVNVEKFIQKKKKGRYQGVLTVALLALAAFVVVKFVVPEKTSKQEDKATSIQPRLERPQQQGVAPANREAADVGRGWSDEFRKKTPDVETFAEKRSRQREVPPIPPVDEPTTRPEPQSQANLDKLSPKELFEKGASLDDDSDREIALYQQALEKDPGYAPAYYRLGAIYFRRADYDLAAEYFVKFHMNATEQQKQAYNTDLYFLPEDLELIKEAMEGASSEEATPEVTAESSEAKSREAGERESTETIEEVQSIVTFSATNGHMVVDAVLNASESASLLFDTGAGVTVISRKLARSLGLTVQSGRPIRLKTVASEVKAQVATLDSITLGTFTRAGFPVAVVDFAMLDNNRFEGILGMDFLSNYSIRIDNQSKRIFLSPKNPPSQ
jgi:clan AA aspartic protease (TIGR02281 family)